MYKARIHRLLRLAQARLERDVPVEEIKKLLTLSLQEVTGMQDVGDPFASQIDEFLKEKQSSPQDDLEKKQSDEGVPATKDKAEDTPQEDLQEKMSEEGVPNKEAAPQDSPQEDLQEKHISETTEAAGGDPLEQQIVSALKRIADE